MGVESVAAMSTLRLPTTLTIKPISSPSLTSTSNTTSVFGTFTPQRNLTHEIMQRFQSDFGSFKSSFVYGMQAEQTQNQNQTQTQAEASEAEIEQLLKNNITSSNNNTTVLNKNNIPSATVSRTASFIDASKPFTQCSYTTLNGGNGKSFSTTNENKEDKRSRSYMVCLDGSDNAFRALTVAKRLMQPNKGDHLYIVSIPPLIEVNPGLGEEFINALHKERDLSIEKLLNQAAVMCESYPHLKGHITTVAGTPAGGPREEILTLAEKYKVDFLVLGSRGLSPMKRLLLGSISNYVINHAHCNVIVVK